MVSIVKIAKHFSKNAREKRASIFRDSFDLNDNTRLLDLGSEDCSNINLVLQGTPVKPDNIYIADIDPELIEAGQRKYGYIPVLINEYGTLPFDDGFFDVVYCSSVIEHVTVPKEQVWSLYSGSQFKKRALARQKQFADEIIRLGKQYFVQTPYRHFPIESHSWLPFIAWMPRFALVPFLKLTNMFWVKGTSPDWYLPSRTEMKLMFEGARIIDEKSLGLTKSLMAINNEQRNPDD